MGERVLIDRTGGWSAPAKRLPVELAGLSHIRPGDRRERDKLGGIDLGPSRADSEAAPV